MSIDYLPNEILHQIMGLLPRADLARLGRTNKQLRSVAVPLLWANLDFICSAHDKFQWHDRHSKSCVFRDLLSSWQLENSVIHKTYAHMRNLNVVVIKPVVEAGFWAVLPSFSNLESLELCAAPEVSGGPMEPTLDDPLPNLSTLKMYGYIPREVAAWLMKSSPTLKHLEIGALERPIESELCLEKPQFFPEENLNSDSDVDSDYGSLCAEEVCPRPLSGFLPRNGCIQLPKLSFLYLGQPARNLSGRDLYTFSTRAEEGCLADWRHLLMASSPTLKTLALEQNPVAEEIEGDSYTSADYLRCNEDGSINKALCEMVEKLVASQGEFPALGQVYMYGFAICSEGQQQADGSIPGGRLLLALEKRGVQCEARLGSWCRFEYADGACTYCQRWCQTQSCLDPDEDSDDYDDYGEGKASDILASTS